MTLRHRRLLALVALAIALVLIVSSVFFVDETQYVLVTRFGRVVRVLDDPQSDPGLHLKWPFESVRRFDRRLQLYDPPAREMLTRDKKNLTVDSYVCWRIENVEKFQRSFRSLTEAESRLGERVRAILADSIGKVDLTQLVAAEPGQSSIATSSAPAPLDDLTRRVTAAARGEAAQQYGIEVVDIRLRRFNLPEANRDAVFRRMRSERDRIVMEYRSQGESEARKIRSEADRKRSDTLAEASKESQIIRGRADAKATEIYSQAHSKDPQFYQLLRTLEAYRNMFKDDKTTVVLSTGSGLLKLLTDGMPQLPAAKPAGSPSANGPPVPAANGSTGGTQP